MTTLENNGVRQRRGPETPESSRRVGIRSDALLDGASTHSFPKSIISPRTSINTPTLLPTDDRSAESWIQQSLVMPSAINNEAGESNNNNYNNITTDGGVGTTMGTTTDEQMNTPTTNLRHMQREESLGSGFFTRSDNYSAIYSATQTQTPVATRTTAVSNHNYNDYNEIVDDDIGNILAGTPARNETDNIASHPYFNSTTREDWGSSSIYIGDDSLLAFSSSSNIMDAAFTTSFSSNASISGPTMANRNPLNGAQVTSTSSLRGGEEDTTGTIISSEIHDAARITDWKAVVELCKQQPESAAYTGTDGWTALHHACDRRCPYPHVVECLIRAYPDALLAKEDEKRWLPLHSACRFKAPRDVVRLLLHMYPEKGRVSVSRPDRKGRSPLYYAVRYNAPSGVMGLLLEMDASAVLEEDQNSDSPLALVWNDWADKLDGKRKIQDILSSTQNINNADTTGLEHRIKQAKIVRRQLERNTNVLDKWNKVNVFLKAAFGFPLDEDWEREDNTYLEEKKKDAFSGRSQQCDSTEQEERIWRVLHAISAIKCHHSLFLLAASLHPEQVFELDRNDLMRIDNINKSKDSSEFKPSNLTALHLAASSHAGGDTGKMVLTQLLALNPSAAESIDTEGSTPLHRISENKFKSDWNVDGVEDVYGSHKNAIMATDVNGRLPLHRASIVIRYYNNSLEDHVVRSRSVMCKLLHERVDAATRPDHFGCLPLHLIAQHGRSWDVQVQALYDANTAAVRVRTGVKFGNRLPIHIASANADSDFSMISKLVEYNPRGASQADRKGFLPLHLACESGHSWDSVQVIHEAFPLAVEQAEQNSRGWNALHIAASSEYSDNELISRLLGLNPEAASIHDSDDRYPLHLACMSGKGWEDGLSSLFRANANAIRCPDKEGMLPLYIVAFRYCYKPPVVCESNSNVNDVKSRRSSSFIVLEADQLTAKKKKEARELSNIFEMLKADPTVL